MVKGGGGAEGCERLDLRDKIYLDRSDGRDENFEPEADGKIGERTDRAMTDGSSVIPTKRMPSKRRREFLFDATFHS